MCTIGRFPVGTACEAHHRTNGADCTLRDRKEREGYGAERCRNSFLKTALTPISPHTLLKPWYGEEYNVITQENYEFLRDSYFCYAGLLQVKATHEPGNSLGESISRIYHDMSRIVGDEIGLNIEQNQGRLYFNLWKCHRWGDCTLYYFPLKFMENLNSTLRRIAYSFVHELMRSNGIFAISDDEEDVWWVFEWMSEDNDDTEEEKEKREKLLHSYRKGRIGKLLDSIGRKTYYKNLPKALGTYKPQNDFERLLTDVMKDGLEFLHPQKPLMEYAYDPYCEEEQEYPPMSLEQQVRVVYDLDDRVTDFLLEHYNSSRQETYDIVPCKIMALSPETDRLFSMDDNYPERFFKWADKFINIVN